MVLTIIKIDNLLPLARLNPMCAKVVRYPPAPYFEPGHPGFPGCFSFISLEITGILNFDSLKNSVYTT
jgi:hypothetical protein